MAAAAMNSHEDAVIRLAGVAGFGTESAQQILAEVGTAVLFRTFRSARTNRRPSWRTFQTRRQSL
jgi:hypothetical protein